MSQLPPAVSTRLPYGLLPERIRSWVDETAADVNLPGLRAFRRRESSRLFEGAARRLWEA
jgi:hypothetical protein